MRVVDEIAQYVKNYRSRHANNINLLLHIIGIPEVIVGVAQILTGSWKIGLLNSFLGYLWQWIGHTYFEKNEVGEFVGIKKLIKKYIGKAK